jgi:predicted deacylase
MPETLGVYHYHGKLPGLNLLVLGGVHGDEVGCTTAIARLKLELDLGLIKLATGTLTLVPMCNPSAYKAGRRYVDVNLNRIIAHHPNPQFPEHHYANQLVGLIEQADVLLDLHSYSAGTLPYVFLDYPTPENIKFAYALGLKDCITGWPELYESVPGLSEGDTILHAHNSGKPGLVVECGSHEDPNTVMVAYQCLLRALTYWGLLEGASPVVSPPQVWRVDQVIVKDRAGIFTRAWQNLDKVGAGAALIHFEDGSSYLAPYAGVIILPDAKAGMGQEWIYLGRKETLAG